MPGHNFGAGLNAAGDPWLEGSEGSSPGDLQVTYPVLPNCECYTFARQPALFFFFLASNQIVFQPCQRLVKSPIHVFVESSSSSGQV